MPALIRLTFAALLAVCASLAHAGSLPATAKAEIEAVLTALKSSGCQFNRNGTWYSGADAQTHLTKKLVYLEDKNLIKSAEEFIELGASTSSASGKPYQVRCGAVPAVDSKLWIQSQLKSLRATKP
jgi:Family of unknown function (DUF5329)